MAKHSDVGVEFPQEPRAKEPMDGVWSDRAMVVIPGAEGELEHFEVASFAELVERCRPTVAATIRNVATAPLGAVAADLPEVGVELRVGAESPGNAEADFGERSLVWKPCLVNAPAGTDPIAARPLLAGRTEQHALQCLLQAYHQQRATGGESELVDPAVRKYLAAALRRHADELDELVRRHPPKLPSKRSES